MITHLKAIEAALVAGGVAYETFRIRAVKPASSDYVVLEAPGWGRPEEMPVCGASDELSTDIRVKAVAGTTDGVLIMLGRIRDVLSPHLVDTPLDVADRSASIWFVRSEFVDVDPDVTITTTSLHPALGVDTYHLQSEPRS